jgi:L,D-transpeptidase YcbB
MLMSGVRIDSLFASAAAVILLLSAGGATAIADPLNMAKIEAEAPAIEGAAAPAASAAVEEPPATQPSAPAAADPDSLIADQLQGLADGKFDAIIGKKPDRIVIDAFYSGRSYAPLWITGGKPNARGKAVAAYLAQVDADGLDPADYPAPDFAALSDPAALAEADIRLTMSVITYAHHAQVGRVHWSRVSADILYAAPAPEIADVLAAVVSATDVAATLDAYEPHEAAYLALKAKLAELRGGKDGAAKTPIPNGVPPKIGASDDRVPLLRARLGLRGDGTTYDLALADAVKKFQLQRGLKPTGTLTQATVDAFNARVPDRTADIIIANMERWRWAPHDLGKTYVIVNLPDFTLRVIQDGKQVWMTKIVDGKPASPTPIMSAEMKSISINPTWNVPDSIASNEYLPLLRQDPTILGRMGLDVRHNPDGSIHISQPPGPNNALGQLRFNFPNKFLVYQHDSNQKYLFANPTRDDSHGCMRVEDPAKYAEVLLSIVRPGERYTADRIRSMFGTVERDISFPTIMPVHLTYQTAFVDEQGKLQLRDDMYGRDRALLAVLKGDDRKVADTAVERRDNVVRREALAMPEQAWGGWTGQNFFARMFGAPVAAQQPQGARRPVAQR